LLGLRRDASRYSAIASQDSTGQVLLVSVDLAGGNLTQFTSSATCGGAAIAPSSGGWIAACGTQIIRLHDDGSLDTTFATGGILRRPPGVDYDTIVERPSGGFLASGRDSSRDLRFLWIGSDGVVAAGGDVSVANTGANDTLAPLALPDGRFVIAGHTMTSSQQFPAFAATLEPGGLDPAFDLESYGLVSADGPIPIAAVADASGRVVVGGVYGGALRLVRILP
jgi:hypothetical protein